MSQDKDDFRDDYDTIIGSDLVYSRPIGIMLGKTIAKLLRRKQGKKITFYGIMQSSRNGLSDLIETLQSEQLNLKQEIFTDSLHPDLPKDTRWMLLECFL